MATFKYVIKKDKGKPVLLGDGTTTVYIKYTHEQKSAIFSTGVRVKVDEWQDDQQYPVRGRENETKNKRIRECKSDLEKLAAQLTEPSTKNMRAAYKAKQKEGKAWGREEDVVKQYEKYLAELLHTKEKSTIRTLAITRHKLKKFIAKQKNKSLSVVDIDLKFYEKFKKFLSEEEGNSDHTIGNRISNLKHFLNWYENRGGKVHADIKNKAFKAYREKQKSNIYLSRQELSVFGSFEFQEEHLRWAQDYFVLQCNTGLSMQDILRIRPRHIQEDFLEIVSEKTGKKICIPLSAKAKKIISKYGCQLPKKLQHRYNLYLKDALRMAGIDSQVEIQRKFQGKDQMIRIPKYQAISSQNAVKTFITLSLQAGVSPKTVAEITGKTVAAIIRHYTAESSNELKSEMAKVFDSW